MQPIGATGRVERASMLQELQTTMGRDGMAKALVGLADRYPPELRSHQLRDVERICFHVGFAERLAPAEGTVVDIGGGVGLLSLAVALTGRRSLLIDDFGDRVNETFGRDCLTLHREFGVAIDSRDVIAEGLDLRPESIDLVMTFESMEHWHHSPRAMLHQAVAALKPGGHLVIGVPNCVNLRKRITVPLGRGKWSSMADWYEQPRFRGHVREPDVDDLRYVCRDLGLQLVQLLGRNWMAYVSPRPWVRRTVRFVDRALRPFPTLCSDIYLVARKN